LFLSPVLALVSAGVFPLPLVQLAQLLELVCVAQKQPRKPQQTLQLQAACP
jgi:hypothetical protein